MTNFVFGAPRCVFEPGGAVEVGRLVAEIGCRRVLCIYDKGVKAAGIVDPIWAAMEEAGLTVFGFEDVEPDPSVAVVEAAGDAARDCSAEAIVAVGGGSALDTAKLAAVLAANGQPLQAFYNRGLIANMPLPLIAVPTTSGTGSEVTPAAVVSEPAEGKKVTLVDAKLVPKTVILDPQLTLGLPASITAATGMDAFAHAVESMTCILHNPMTDGIALGAIRLIQKNLRTCVEDGTNLEARGNMMIAATMAGMAFGNTAAHVGHAFAHAMGALWHIPHGTACALALPFAVKNCAAAAPQSIGAIGAALGLPEGRDAAMTAAGIAEWISGFSASIGIPTLRKLGVSYTELERIVEATLGEKLIHLSGVPVSAEDCRLYYEELFNQ